MQPLDLNKLQRERQKKENQEEEMFFFYNFNFDLPTEYYKQLGDFSAVQPSQARKIKEFMTKQWPIVSTTCNSVLINLFISNLATK